jgi:hypothetical protein
VINVLALREGFDADTVEEVVSGGEQLGECDSRYYAKGKNIE